MCSRCGLSQYHSKQAAIETLLNYQTSLPSNAASPTSSVPPDAAPSAQNKAALAHVPLPHVRKAQLLDSIPLRQRILSLIRRMHGLQDEAHSQLLYRRFREYLGL